MVNKQKSPDREKAATGRTSERGRRQSGQPAQEADPQTDPRRQQGSWSGEEGDANRSDDGQRQAAPDPHRQQGGWSRDEDGLSRQPGRTPPTERDRDYDPDGDRAGRQ